MSLKCPICGNEYYYDGKICQICENKSTNNRLIKKDKVKSQKWNCGVFLEFETPVFGKYKPNGAYIKIASEPKFSDFKSPREYTWNCNSTKIFKKFYTLNSGISQLRNIKKSQITLSKGLKQDLSNPLIYE